MLQEIETIIFAVKKLIHEYYTAGGSKASNGPRVIAIIPLEWNASKHKILTETGITCTEYLIME